MEEAPQSTKVYQPVLATALGILFVSTASIFIRFAQAEASSIVIAAARLVIASMVLLPLAFFRYREELRRLTKTEYQKANPFWRVPGIALRLMDHLTSIYIRCFLGCAGNHNAFVGGIALPGRAERTDSAGCGHWTGCFDDWQCDRGIGECL